jgi:hypothetical protein
MMQKARNGMGGHGFGSIDRSIVIKSVDQLLFGLPRWIHFRMLLQVLRCWFYRTHSHACAAACTHCRVRIACVRVRYALPRVRLRVRAAYALRAMQAHVRIAHAHVRTVAYVHYAYPRCRFVR